MANLLLRKRLAALKDAARPADGQGDAVMRVLDRMKSANRRAEEDEAGAFRLRISPPVIAAILVVMAVSVGWTWFMGYMVGQGQNPVIQAEKIAEGALPKADAPDAAPESDVDADPAPTGEIVEPDPGAAKPAARNDANPASPSAGAPASTRTTPAPAAKAAASGGRKPESPAPSPATKAASGRDAGDAGKAAPAARDAKISAKEKAASDGNSAVAKRDAKDARAKDAKKDSGNAAKAKEAARNVATAPAAKAKDAASGRFDYVFQVGAFKGPVDSNRLRERLGAKGFRAAVRQSGNVYLVTVSLRGDAGAGDRLRAEMRRMGLGAPLILSRKEAGKR